MAQKTATLKADQRTKAQRKIDKATVAGYYAQGLIVREIAAKSGLTLEQVKRDLNELRAEWGEQISEARKILMDAAERAAAYISDNIHDRNYQDAAFPPKVANRLRACAMALNRVGLHETKEAGITPEDIAKLAEAIGGKGDAG